MTSRAVFSGYDASDHINLWVTDGTAAGTSELTPAGAYYYGLLDLGVSPDFTALGGRLLFLGVDSSGHDSLWVTDGTSAGTSELSVEFRPPQFHRHREQGSVRKWGRSLGNRRDGNGHDRSDGSVSNGAGSL